jgi:NAD(P)-dependent dehydrogenase (short-subunit alcohol dehydrogenase family)
MDTIALITGANRGIGFAVAKGLLEKGITVIITSRNPGKGQKAVDELKAVGKAFYHVLEVTDAESIRQARRYVEKEWGRLDVLINNAAIHYDSWHHTLNADLEQTHETFETNFFAPWRLVQDFLPLLRKSENARIVNVSSGAGALRNQTGNTPGYSLSKLALNGLTLQLAAQLEKEGIQVNAVCPGWVRTDMGGPEAPRSVQEGAASIMAAALMDKDGPTGKFFRDGKEIDW